MGRAARPPGEPFAVSAATIFPGLTRLRSAWRGEAGPEPCIGTITDAQLAMDVERKPPPATAMPRTNVARRRLPVILDGVSPALARSGSFKRMLASSRWR